MFVCTILLSIRCYTQATISPAQRLQSPGAVEKHDHSDVKTLLTFSYCAQPLIISDQCAQRCKFVYEFINAINLVCRSKIFSLIEFLTDKIS